MRPDLMRLLVDTRRKELITHADTGGPGGLGSYSTLERVGLSASLAEPKPDVRPMKKRVPHTKVEAVGNVDGGLVDGAA